MIRYDVDIRLAPIEEGNVRAAVVGHHRGLSHSGDSFMPNHQLDASHQAVLIDGKLMGVTACSTDELTLLTLTPEAKRYDRQVMEIVLRETGRAQAYAASWDPHHMDLFGSFATETSCQAYQFELTDAAALRAPITGLQLRLATDNDLPYLESSGFQSDYKTFMRAGQLRIAEHNGDSAGIGVMTAHRLAESTVDIGMFVNEDRRHGGIGRSIIALLAREALDTGRQPVAGCWWRNWESRRTLEAAGLTCIGTIFRFTLDQDRFKNQAAI